MHFARGLKPPIPGQPHCGHDPARPPAHEGESPNNSSFTGDEKYVESQESFGLAQIGGPVKVE